MHSTCSPALSKSVPKDVLPESPASAIWVCLNPWAHGLTHHDCSGLARLAEVPERLSLHEPRHKSVAKLLHALEQTPLRYMARQPKIHFFLVEDIENLWKSLIYCPEWCSSEFAVLLMRFAPEPAFTIWVAPCFLLVSYLLFIFLHGPKFYICFSCWLMLAHHQ